MVNGIGSPASDRCATLAGGQINVDNISCTQHPRALVREIREADDASAARAARCGRTRLSCTGSERSLA
jgi:hypothetical protein